MSSILESAPFRLPAAPLATDLVAKYFRGLGDPIRLRILELLRYEGELSVGELVEKLGLPQPKVSNHLACLRRMCDDRGWIKTLMDEAENERMHLMTFIEIAKPTLFERAVIIGVQWVFYLCFFGLYLVSAKTAHRVVGYFEEEAVISYTHYLAEIDEGRSANVPAPAIARRYWGLPDDATLRDVVLVVRADEAHHRDVNHGFANELGGLPVGKVAECPPHDALEPNWKRAA